MKKSYKSHMFFSGIKMSCQNALRQNKFKFILTICLVIVSLSTGIFIAIKSNQNYNLGQRREIDLCDYYSGAIATASAFGQRALSLILNLILLTLLSFTPFCFPLAELLLMYRAYLFGLNFTLIFIFYGVGSIITAVVIVLPCQLLLLGFLTLFYFIMLSLNCRCKRYGSCETNRWIFVLISLLILILINLCETILLFVLNGKVILVI